MSEGGDCKTAQAKPGMLNIQFCQMRPTALTQSLFQTTTFVSSLVYIAITSEVIIKINGVLEEPNC